MYIVCGANASVNERAKSAVFNNGNERTNHIGTLVHTHVSAFNYDPS